MSGNMILTIMAISNAVLVLALVLLLIFGQRQRIPSGNAVGMPQSPAESGDAFTAASIGQGENIPARANSRELDYSAKVKVALAMMENGIDPEVVAAELGFSGSEMGVLVASIKRVLRVETLPTIQK